MLYAQRLALKMEVPLHVCFCLVPKFLDATIRHYRFILKGLEEVEKVKIIIRHLIEYTHHKDDIFLMND